MDKDLENLEKLAADVEKQNKKYFATIKKRVPKNFDVAKVPR